MGLLLALAPVAAIIWYIYTKDEFEKEPTALLITCFMLGVLSVIPAVLGGMLGSYLGYDLTENIFTTFIHAFIVVGLSEELGKFLFLILFIFPKKDFNEPYDGIIYAVMIGMGFATFENIVYVVEGGIDVALLRMFTAVPAHAAFGVIMGYYVGMAKFDHLHPENRPILLLMALFWATLAHGAYDFFLMQQSVEGLVLVAFVVLAIALYFSKKAIDIHNEASPFHPKNKVTQATPQVQTTVTPSTMQGKIISPKVSDQPTAQDKIIPPKVSEKPTIKGKIVPPKVSEKPTIKGKIVPPNPTDTALNSTASLQAKDTPSKEEWQALKDWLNDSSDEKNA